MHTATHLPDTRGTIALHTAYVFTCLCYLSLCEVPLILPELKCTSVHFKAQSQNETSFDSYHLSVGQALFADEETGLYTELGTRTARYEVTEQAVTPR